MSEAERLEALLREVIVDLRHEGHWQWAKELARDLEEVLRG